MSILEEKKTLTITYSTYCIYILKVVDLIIHICKLFFIMYEINKTTSFA